MVGATGFEPATSASRTQRSARLSYAPMCDRRKKRNSASALGQHKSVSRKIFAKSRLTFRFPPFYIPPFRNAGQIAQLVEQRTENPCVPSSTLGLATTFPPPKPVGGFFPSAGFFLCLIRLLRTSCYEYSVDSGKTAKHRQSAQIPQTGAFLSWLSPFWFVKAASRSPLMREPRIFRIKPLFP